MEKTAQPRVIAANERGWSGVTPEGYRPGAATGVERHTIVGHRKNTEGENGPSIEVRYFELQPGAVSRLEKHEHEHFVIVKRGFGYAVVETNVSEVAPNDVVYVAPMELHQFVARGDEPFGFYCIVNAVRDFAQEPSSDDLARLNASPAGQVVKPFAVPLSKRNAP